MIKIYAAISVMMFSAVALLSQHNPEALTG
jgi:hypothetical protein